MVNLQNATETVPIDSRNLLGVLRRELEFLEKDGYAGTSTRWRPRFIFEDSPSCPNFNAQGERVPCENCVLAQLVPQEYRDKPLCCRYIPLRATGETIDYFYKCGTDQELQDAFRTWLVRTIARLEQEELNV
jgi:hypothetical protein